MKSLNSPLVFLSIFLVIASCGERNIIVEQKTKLEPMRTFEITEQTKIVDKQIEAYNAGDIEAFLTFYSDDFKAYTYPGILSMDGKEKMRQIYAPFFNDNPNLNCTIKNRTVIGNKVIDHEQVTGLENGNTISCVAIYEVVDGVIARVEFIYH